MKFLSKLSRLGLVLVGIQTVLLLSIPLLTKVYQFPCNVICILSDQIGYFILLNIPGWLLWGTPVGRVLDSLKPQTIKLSGEIYITDYLFMFLFSAVAYYLIGFLIEKLWHRWRQPQ